MIVPALFFCSGATALIYEVVWSKYLSQMFGSTVHAQTTVLAVFMGGLAIGNRLFGARADKSTQPLAIYGYIEAAIGLYAFFFNWFFHWADAAFVGLGSGRLANAGLLLSLKALFSVLLLLGPTILMGGTLPLLAAWLQRQSLDAGRWSARFYSINSLGAVAGAGFAGFYLVRNLGMVSSLQMTALVNVLVGITAVAIARQQRARSGPAMAESSQSVADQGTDAQSALRSACALVALSGGVSMGLEVLASRSLALIFGSSLQAFAIVLMAFILGIGLGSSVIASPRIRRLNRNAFAVALLLAAACWIGLLVLAIEQWVYIYRVLRTGVARTEVGYGFHQMLAATMSMIVLGLPAGLLGAVLPVCIRAVSEKTSTLANQIGRLLTWNTLGAVGGVLVTGFVLMPTLGLRGSFGLLAVLLGLTATLIAARQRRTLAAGVSAGATAVLLLVSVTGGEGWRHVLSSGVFRSRETEVDPAAFEARKKHMKILFYEDAADATVTVEQGDGIVLPANLGLRINGKPEASTRADLATQYLLAHLPILARPESKHVFVLGFGSGITAGALLGHPLELVTIAENCKPVLRAAKFFEPWNRGVLTNAIVRTWNEDGRTVLKLSPQPYDVIISEPSNPWMIGVGSVFSQEFYELAASRLKDGGIMAQWFHVYEMSDAIVALVFRTFSTVFPYVEIWDAETGDLILLGSKRPWPSSPEAYQKVFEREQPRKDLQEIGLASPASVWARQLASQRTAFAVAGEGAIQSDVFPILEYDAPKAFFLGEMAQAITIFDERTWQAELAPSEKRSTLAALGEPLVRAAFTNFGSANREFERHLRGHFGQGDEGAAPPGTTRKRPLACVFFPTAHAAAPQNIPENASPELKRLLEAETLVRTDATRWQEGASAAESVLDGLARNATKPPNWAPSYFATVIARTSLGHGDRARAKRLVDLGLKLEPDALELNYLARILEREAGSTSAASAPATR